MTSGFTFHDYIDADGSGINVISDWLNNEGKEAKAYFMVMIPQLEASTPPGYQDSLWREQYTKPMDGEWGGFREFRKTGSVQYRLLGKVEGRNVFLVASAIHKDQHYDTTVTPQIAMNRVNQMKDNPAKYRRVHECN